MWIKISIKGGVRRWMWLIFYLGFLAYFIPVRIRNFDNLQEFFSFWENGFARLDKDTFLWILLQFPIYTLLSLRLFQSSNTMSVYIFLKNYNIKKLIKSELYVQIFFACLYYGLFVIFTLKSGWMGIFDIKDYIYISGRFVALMTIQAISFSILTDLLYSICVEFGIAFIIALISRIIFVIFIFPLGGSGKIVIYLLEVVMYTICLYKGIKINLEKIILGGKKNG